MPSQVLSVAGSTRCLQQALAAANATCPASLAAREVVFLADLPPTGFNAYYLQVGSGGKVRAGAHRAAGCTIGAGAAGCAGDGCVLFWVEHVAVAAAAALHATLDA